LGLGLANSVSVWSWVINNTVIIRVRIGLGLDTGQIPAMVVSGEEIPPEGDQVFGAHDSRYIQEGQSHKGHDATFPSPTVSAA